MNPPQGSSRWTACAGTSTVDYDPGHWKYVAKGTCESMMTPKGHGMLQAM